MVEYKKGVGINFSELAKEQQNEKREVTTVPEILTGQEVAGLFQKIYDQLSPDVNQHLVDSNVVLTAAGLKHHTEFFVDIKSEEDTALVQAHIDKLNALLNAINPEIKFFMVKKPINSPDGKRMSQMISMESLLGAERISKTSKLPGVIPYDRSSGWAGFTKWRRKIMQNFEDAQSTGTKPFIDDEAFINVISGFMKGYPDTAIYDFTEWSPTDRSRDMQDSKISNSGIYKEAQPNYLFYPEHAGNSDIQENIKQAEKILQEFYDSEFHKSIAPQLQHRK